MRRLITSLCLAVLPLSAFALDTPARAAEKGCAWESFSSGPLGLEARVQRCDFGFRKIEFVERGSSLAILFSDGGEADPLIDVIPLQSGESAQAAMRRSFRAGADADVSGRCSLVPFAGAAGPKGVERYTFVPDAAYQKELDAEASPDEVPEPACGDFGEMPDGIQYFEVHPGAASILFVRIGQETPLFDETSLRIWGR